jgi:DNA-binding NarL/FixJ family response regulator
MIMIIEDHAELRQRLHAWLEILYTQYQVSDFENVEGALDSIKSHRPALVLMDIGLPGMNGIDGTRIVKQIDPNIFVIVTTQLTGNGHKYAALKAGANAFIPKDHLFRDLAPAMDRLLFPG